MFGPIMRMLYLRPIATSSSWPSWLPVSAKPEGMRMAAAVFFSARSVRGPATGLAGIARAGEELGRNRAHRGVDLARDVLDALARLVAHDPRRLGVDRVDLALVAAVD